jgi:acetyl-CoA carboxylase biotin carboxyl carrier protein
MDLKELKALLRLMEGNDVEELEVEEGGRRVRIRRRSAQGAVNAPGAQRPVPASLPGAKIPSTSNVAASEAAGLVPIEAPMVGTFYRAPAPGADPYVKEGDIVQKGTVVCIIEAMKLMNEIETEVAGRIVNVMAENGQPVEFGQALFLVEPV